MAEAVILSYPSITIPDQLKMMFMVKTIKVTNDLTSQKTNQKSTEYLKYKTVSSGSWISLPIPSDFAVNLSHTWEESDTIAIDKSLLDTAISAGTAKLSKTLGFGDKIAGIVGGTSSYTAKVGHYEDTAPLDFTFTWKFTPQSEDEVWKLHNIVKIFQLGSMPKGLSEIGGFKISYVKPPNLFDMKLLGSTKILNPGLKHYYFKDNTITDLAITNVDVNYTPDGDFYPFMDGTPTSFDLSLKMKQTQNTINFRDIFGERTLSGNYLKTFNGKP